MTSDNESWQQLITKYPGDFSFRGKLAPLFPLALEEFNKLSDGRWSLDNYTIAVSMSDDESYAAISFIPDPAHSINGVPIEEADRWMYPSEGGVVYVYSLSELKLVKTTYMR